LIGNQEIHDIKRIARRFNMNIMPLDMPNSDAMLQKRLDSALAYVGTTKAVANNAQIEALQKNLAERSSQELVTLSTRLLVEKFLTLPTAHPSEQGDITDSRGGGRRSSEKDGFSGERRSGGRSGGGRRFGGGGRGRGRFGGGGFRRDRGGDNAASSFKRSK
jgi:hypothetical protein